MKRFGQTNWIMTRAVLPGVLSVAGLVAGMTSASGQCAPGSRQPPLRQSMLVTPAWLAAHRSDSNLVILHVGHEAKEFDSGHVPGARLAQAHAFFTGDPPGAELPTVAALDSVIEGLGISDNSKIVIYGSPWMVGRVYLALEAVGLGDQTAVLDGGLSAWSGAQQPVSREAAVTPRRGHFTPKAKTGIVVDANWVQGHLRDPKVVVLDGRSPEEYAGPNKIEQLPRYGHLPGAHNLNWSTTFVRPAEAEDGHDTPLLAPDELRRLFREAGFRPGEQLVTYCTVGFRASHLYFVARYLGYDVKIYDGSMSDWAARSALPLATGHQP